MDEASNEEEHNPRRRSVLNVMKKPARGSKFNYSWCEKFAWLYYDEEKGKAFCKYCVKAHKINKLAEGVDNFARVTGNKGTWASHDKSSGHKGTLHSYEVRPNILHKLQATGVLEAVRGRRAAVSAGHGAYVSAPEHSDAWTLTHRRKLPATTWISVPPRR